MSRSHAQDDLDAQLKFHQREWRIQRIGWALVALFLALALGGLFGDGCASSCARTMARQVVSSTNASCAMACRRISSSRRPAAHRGSIALRSTRRLPRSVSCRAHHARAGLGAPERPAHRVRVRRAAAPGASISFHIRPQRLWRHTSGVSIDGGARVEISQLTYP